MVVRFTEFLKLEDKDLGLYIIQEDDTTGGLCFRIYAKLDVNTAIFLCRKEDKTWHLFPQNSPEWVERITHVVGTVIEKRIANL